MKIVDADESSRVMMHNFNYLTLLTYDSRFYCRNDIIEEQRIEEFVEKYIHI
jgi:hypothetical protein